MEVNLSAHVDEVGKEISVEEFRRKYFDPQRPVVIRGLAYNQAAGERWTMDYFRDNLGDLTIDLYDNRNKRHEEQTTTVPDLQMPFREYLDLISKDEETPLRMFLFNLYKYRKELREEFNTPELIAGPMKKLGFMFCGGKNTSVRAHYDVDRACVLLTQFIGQKRVILVAPEYSDFMYRVPFNCHSNVDLKDCDFETHPGLRHVKGIEVVLNHGDAVFMPAGWWHYNTYLNGGLGVSYRQFSPRLKDRIIGAKNLTVMMYFDKMMQAVARKPWADYKERLMYKRVDKAIHRKKRKRRMEKAKKQGTFYHQPLRERARYRFENVFFG